MLKICLMGLILLASGCGLPEFPSWSPYIAIPSKDKKIKCFLVDKERMLFECEKESSLIGDSLDGYFCTSPNEQVEIIRWLQRAKKEVDKKLKSKDQKIYVRTKSSGRN